MKIKDRLKSWAVWVSVFGAIGLILSNLGIFEKIGIDSVTWDACVTALCSVLVAFGILNNPTDRDNF